MFGDFFLTIAAIAFCFSGEWFYNQVQASIKILCFRKLANKMTRLAQGQTGRMLKELLKFYSASAFTGFINMSFSTRLLTISKP